MPWCSGNVLWTEGEKFMTEFWLLGVGWCWMHKDTPLPLSTLCCPIMFQQQFFFFLFFFFSTGVATTERGKAWHIRLVAASLLNVNESDTLDLLILLDPRKLLLSHTKPCQWWDVSLYEARIIHTICLHSSLPYVQCEPWQLYDLWCLVTTGIINMIMIIFGLLFYSDCYLAV